MKKPALVLVLLVLTQTAVPITVEAQAGGAWSWQARELSAPPYRNGPVPRQGRVARLATAPRQEPATGAAGQTLLSLALPGLGQHQLGKSRKWLFAGLEVAAWVVYMERRSAGGSLRDDYRDFAWQVGRIQVGPRVDADFNYYETLSKWDRSGAFDRDAASSGLQPEEDPATFNGTIWARAQAIFLGGGGQPGDVGFAQALEYYEARAYETEFLWDWNRTTGGRSRLGEIISESDSRFRQATTALGVVIANHLVSAVDAFLSTRGIVARANVGFTTTCRAPRGLGWSARITVPVGP